MGKALIIAVNARYLGGLAQMARSCGDAVVAAAVGSAGLADEVALGGADEVALFETDDGVPAEAMAAAVAQWAKDAGFTFAACNDAPAARVILASVASAIGASVLGDVRAAACAGDGFDVTCTVAGGIAYQRLHVAGALAAVFGGDDASCAAEGPAPVQRVDAQPSGARIVGQVLPAADAVDLSEAARIVGVGRGVRSSDDLAEIEALAAALGASMACTLPLAEDSHWYPGEQVLGSSHNSASPELYLALGISGSPNHLSGVKGAGTVVAVNKDPEAAVFKHCDYGVVCDLYEFVPALREALGG